MKKLICFFAFFTLLSVISYADQIENPFNSEVLEIDSNYYFPTSFAFSSKAGDYYEKDFDVKTFNTWSFSANYFATKKFTVGLKATSARSKGTERETKTNIKGNFDSTKRGYGVQIQYFFAGKLTERKRVQGSFCPYLGASYLREREYYKKNSEYTYWKRYYTETWNGHSTGVFGGIIYMLSNDMALATAYNYQMYGFNENPAWPPRNADLKYKIGSIFAGIKIYL